MHKLTNNVNFKFRLSSVILLGYGVSESHAEKQFIYVFMKIDCVIHIYTSVRFAMSFFTKSKQRNCWCKKPTFFF